MYRYKRFILCYLLNLTPREVDEMPAPLVEELWVMLNEQKLKESEVIRDATG